MDRTLKDRIRLARKQRGKFKGYITCKCCNVSIKTIEHKYIKYNSTSGYGSICIECFYDPEVPFDDIIKYYTQRTSFPGHPNDFTEKEINVIVDNLIDEVDNGTDHLKINAESLKQKWQRYQMTLRDIKIDKILEL